MASLPDATTSTWLARVLNGSCRISRAAALSSTTSTRKLRELLGNNLARARGGADAEPDGEDRTCCRPRPRFRARRARPSARPTAGRWSAPARCRRACGSWTMSACTNGWKSFADCSGVMPMPVSRTENLSCTFSPVRSSSSMFSRISPRSVNLTALLTKFVRIWPRRSGSPSRCSGISGETWARNSRPLSCAFWAVSVVTELITSSSRKSVFSMSSLPASIFEKSRMSLMMASSDVPALWTLLT